MSSELRQHIEKITPLTDAEFDYILSHFTVKKLQWKIGELRIIKPILINKKGKILRGSNFLRLISNS